MKPLTIYLNALPFLILTRPNTRVLQQSANVSADIQSLLVIILVILILWWRMISNARQTSQAIAVEYAHLEGHAAPRQDDLTVIEGIGPKIASILQSAGITTYAQLAETDAERLRAILEAAGSRYRLANPATWSEQAALAASGDWVSLQQLQGRLIAGRE